MGTFFVTIRNCKMLCSTTKCSMQYFHSLRISPLHSSPIPTHSEVLVEKCRKPPRGGSSGQGKWGQGKWGWGKEEREEGVGVGYDRQGVYCMWSNLKIKTNRHFVNLVWYRKALLYLFYNKLVYEGLFCKTRFLSQSSPEKTPVLPSVHGAPLWATELFSKVFRVGHGPSYTESACKKIKWRRNKNILCSMTCGEN